MRAGELNEKITFQKPKDIKNKYGATEQVFEDYKTVKASVSRNNGNRAITNNEIVYKYNIVFTIRIIYNIDEAMRVLFDGKMYRICSIIPSKKTQSKTIITELINE